MTVTLAAMFILGLVFILTNNSAVATCVGLRRAFSPIAIRSKPRLGSLRRLAVWNKISRGRLALATLVLAAPMAFAQIAPNCDVDCNPPTPPNAPPTNGQIPVDRGKTFNQTGLGNVASATTETGGTTTVQGSSSFTYAVPLFDAHGAGLDMKLALYYNSHIWIPDVNGGFMMGFDRNTPAPGFQLNFGFVEWNPSANGPAGIVSTPDGAKHSVAINVSNLVYDSTYNTWRCANQVCLYDSTDSSYISVSRPLGTYSGQPCTGPNNCPAKDITVTFKNGTQALYQSFAVVTNDLFDEFVMRPYKIEDSNGNVMTITYTSANDLSISSITDSVNRVYNFFYTDASSGATCGGGGSCTAGSLLNCVTDGVSCSAPGARTFTFSYDVAHPVNFSFSPNSAQVLTAGNLVTVQSGFGTPVLTKVCRPNGACAKFNYGDWATVNDIQELSADGSTVRYEVSYDFPASTAGALTSNPTYTHQTERINGQTNTWTFANNANADGVITSSSITDPTGMIATTTFSNNADWADGLPVQVQITDGPGKVWSTRALAWTSDLAEAQSGITNGGYPTGKNPRPASITVSLDDGSKSQITMAYDNSPTPVAAGAPQPFTGSGSIIDEVETDFGATAPGPVLRETVTQYTSLPDHILGLPTDIKVKDGSGKIVSHRVMAYDGTALQNLSTAPLGHDNVTYSATSGTPRGNLTSSTIYADPIGNTGGVTTTTTYDIRGNRVSEQSGCCTLTSWSYSSNTNYAYPDSISFGPTGSQLTTNFTYNTNGSLATAKDWNGKTTIYSYDASGRLTSTQTPDGITATIKYDDQSANPAVSQSSSANSMATTHIQDFQGHAVADELFNGTSLISTVSYINDAKGRPLQVSNPYKPSESPIYATYVYDLLGRQTQITPPALSTSVAQKPYLISTSGLTTLLTDPAGQQGKQYKNALGQLVRADLPGPSAGATATASLTLAGAEKSVPSNSASNGATAGTAGITISPVAACSSTQQDRCTTVLTHPATPATVTVTIGGSNTTNNRSTTACTGGPPSRLPLRCTTTNSNFPDSGTIQFAVNAGGVTVGPVSVSYSSSSTQAGLAQALAAGLPANGVVSVSYGGGNSFILTTTAKGAATNNSTLSTSVATSCVSSFTDGDNGGSTSVNCAGPGWTITPSQNFAGGSDNGNTTYNDTGNITVSFVVPGVGSSPAIQVSETVPYGVNDSSSSLAQALATRFSSDSNALQFVTASASGSQLNLVTTATGSGTNYSLTLSSVTNSSNFPAGSTSFSISGPAAFIPGQTGTLFDAGTLTATLSGLNSGSAPTETVSYSQGSTTAALAASLVAKISGDSKWSAVTASVASGSSTITLTAVNQGAAANQYSVTIAGTSNFPGSFPSASFASPAQNAQLANGADPAYSITTPVTTTYSYDPLGHQLQISQGQQTQTFVYDGLGRMTSSATPETGGQPVTYSYNDFGAVTQRNDPRLVAGTSSHVTATYSYDGLNRITSISYNDNVTPTVSYAYNPPNSANNTGGRLASVSNTVESKTYQYDVMGRITQCVETIGGNQYIVNYAYGADGQLTSITYPSQLKVNYAYDPIGRLQALSTGTQNILSINPNDYNAAGMATTVTYGNNITGVFGFNNQLQTSSIQYSAPAPATPLLSLTYNYGGAADNGQIVGVTDNVAPSRSTSYQYDPLGRLQMAQTVDQTSANSWKMNYGFDIYGNRLQQSPTGGAAAMPASFTPVDPATNHIQGQGVTYDALGNMVSDGLNNYVFDANSKLVHTSAVPGLGGNPVNFGYGPDGGLVNKSGTYYIYANGRPIAEYAGGAAATSPSAEYINLGLQQIAKIASGVTTYNYPDHLSIRATADSSGSPVSTNGHFPYGETLYHSGSTSEFVFTSYRRDANTGLDYADARFYSSRLGRFVSMDPLMGSNRYAYVNSDPINLIDPSGLDPQQPCSLDPFANFNLPLCGPDQLGNGVGGGVNCGANFSDGGISITFTSNCNSFQVTFQGPENPFGRIQNAVDTLLQLFLNPETCPAGTFECPEDGRRLFGDPQCGDWCIMDYGQPQTVRDCWNDFHKSTAGKGVEFLSLISIIPGANENWKHNLGIEWIALPAAKLAALTALKKGSASAGAQEFWSVIRGTATRIPGPTEAGVTTGETVVKRVALPAIVLATASDLFALANCGDKVHPREHYPPR